MIETLFPRSAPPQVSERNSVVNERETVSPSSFEERGARCDVIIPYDPVNLRWLVASVESILNQVDVECVVHLIADGFETPTDPARQFADLPQVRWYRNDSVIGPYRTLNRIFDRLETSYLAIQDSDDLALPHRIAYSIAQLERVGGEIFGGAMRQFVSYDACDADSLARLRHAPIHSSGQNNWHLCPHGNLVNGTLLLRCETYERLNGFAPLMGSADTEFATRAHRAGCQIVTSQEIVGLRRLHATSLSHGSTHGKGSLLRREYHERVQETYRRMTPGCDFREFGGLVAERSECQRTSRLLK